MSSFSVILCPSKACMVTDRGICCGSNAHGPPSVPTSVRVPWDPVPNENVNLLDPAQNEKVNLHITVQAGFDGDSTLKLSRPTCSETFEWPGTSSGWPFIVRFTEKFELAYPDFDIIPQKFFMPDDQGHLQPTGKNSCPYRTDLKPTINPYYRPGLSGTDYENTEKSIIQPIGYLPSMGAAGPVADANVDPKNEADTNFANSSPAELSSPNFAPLWPGQMASTLGTDLNTAGSDGDVPSFMQSNPYTSKRGMPVEFRA
ncbi:hypothetical protein MMC07_004026 [Pseudocyphellaria aurata]|nr:hypothetical protein [Pseudocyphellaria aurata]